MQEDRLNSLLKFLSFHFSDINFLKKLKEYALNDYKNNLLTESEHCNVESIIDYYIYKLEN